MPSDDEPLGGDRTDAGGGPADELAGETAERDSLDEPLGGDRTDAGGGPADELGDGTAATESGAAAERDVEVVLPEQVRWRVIEYSAEVLGVVPPERIPGPLRPIARFTPAKRARQGAKLIAARLDADEDFRELVAEVTALRFGALAEAIEGGSIPAAADPIEVAALAYLVRGDGWPDQVRAASDAIRTDAARVADETISAELDRLTEQLTAIRRQHRVEVEKGREAVREARVEADRAQARVRELTKEVRSARSAADRAAEELATERGRANAEVASLSAENRRLKSQLTDARSAASAARQAAKEGRSADEARLWLLLDTISSAASGLRRELALSPPDGLPADAIAASQQREADSEPTRAPARGLAVDDPAWLDQLLALPRAHLIVDGYNVTKTGFGELTLEHQRRRLVSGMARVAARTGAEVTVVFDGLDVGSRVRAAMPPPPRGVRVLFSLEGDTADDLIRRLAVAEPPGRPIVVVSSDREVMDGVRRAGAYPVPSMLLVKRITSF